LGPVVLARTFCNFPRSEKLRPNAAAPIPQNFKKSRLEMFFIFIPLDNVESAYNKWNPFREKLKKV
jgi:hypothetical protein